ncbi:MAG: sensor histidine kinase [Motilibacteraceae bacterium]
MPGGAGLSRVGRSGLGARGLRARVVLAFGVGAFLVSVVLVTTTFLLARSYLLDSRERSSTRQAYVDANLLRARLSTAGTKVGDAIADLVPGSGDVVVRSAGTWYSSSLDVGHDDVPEALQSVVDGGDAGTVRTRSRGEPKLVVGVPVPQAGLAFYEVAPLSELETVLRTLGAVLAAGAATATAAGIVLGIRASRLVVQPLEQVAGAAARIAGGDLATRLPATDDPDLVTIVGSFNSMVDALEQRIERDARFVGDVSHELRSPLTTLVTSVEVMRARRGELSERAQEALDLVVVELARFRQTLDDLLELARADAGAPIADPVPVPLALVVEHLLRRTGRDQVALHADRDVEVLGDKVRLERAMANLLDNADRHAGGVAEVVVERRGERAMVFVDDAGPGVPPDQRERVFERFARGPRAARRSLPGAGLGLAIVAETAALHGGAAWCTDSPRGGARFVLSLPVAR